MRAGRYRAPAHAGTPLRVGDVVELCDDRWPAWMGLRCVVDALPGLQEPGAFRAPSLLPLSARPDGRAGAFRWDAARLRRVR